MPQHAARSARRESRTGGGFGRAVRAIALTTVGALAAGTFLTGGIAPAFADASAVVISELQYHPQSDLDTDDFLELTNTSGEAVDVSGWYFSGITLVLPAGTVIPANGYLVVSPDATRFAAIYGTAPNAVYTGKLSNNGEKIALFDTAAVEMDSVTYGLNNPWPSSANAGGPSLELRDLYSDNTLAASWGASTVLNGTPAAVNSIAGAAAPPAAGELTASPARPAPGQSVTVSAALTRGATATLYYKVDFGAELPLPFRDDAASTGGANDGTFSASIPGQDAGHLIRFRVAARANSVDFSTPVAGDTMPYRGVVVTDPSVSSQLPVIEYFMADSVYDDLRTNHRFDDVQGDAVWTYNGQVWDGAKMSIRGASTREQNKVNWKVELPAGYTFDLGGRLPYPLDEFALQNYSTNTADIAWATVRAAGARSLAILPVRTQRNATFEELGRIMETEDGSWRKAQNVKTWAIYKGSGGALAKTASPAALEAELWLNKKTRETEDFTDVWDLTKAVDASASAAQLDWIYDNVNVPEMINYMAINAIIRHWDSGWHNWYVARDTEGSGRWEMWQWDLDLTFGPVSDGRGDFLTPDTSNRFTQAMLNYPEFQDMYYRRLRTLSDQLLVPGAYETQWDSISATTSPEWALDYAKWKTYSEGSTTTKFKQGVADRRSVIASNTGTGKLVPASQGASASAVISELQYNPTGSGGEFLELSNPGGTPVDVSGWAIDAVNLVIQPGTVIPAGGRVVFVADDKAFRAAFTEGHRLVAGTFTGKLSNDGEEVTLRNGGTVIDTVTYSPTDPWPNAANGSGPSLELSSLSADNADPANWTAVSTIGGTPGLPNTGSTDVPTPPAIPTTAKDTFSRTANKGFGTADSGGVWSVSSSSSDYSVSGGVGRLVTPAGSTRSTQLNGVSSSDSDVTAKVSAPRPTAGSLYMGVYGRRTAGEDYRAQAIVSSAGKVQVSLQRTGATLSSATVAGLTYVTGDSLRVRMQATGTNPTVLRAKVWKVGSAEPSSWQVTATDSTPSLQTAGSPGVLSYLSGSATPTSVTVTVDDFASTAASGTPPPPAAPTASFTTAVNDLSVSVNAAASSDSDGTITGYSWNFGDGTPAVSGITATHSYSTAGSYTITLTVTDNSSLTGSDSKPVTVTTATAPPPAAGTIASDAFGRTTSNGFGSADLGGVWSTSGTAANFSVSGGAARIADPAGGMRIAQLNAITTTDADVTATVSTGRVTTGTSYVGLIGRRIGSVDYRVQAIVASTGKLQLQLQRSGTAIATASIASITYASGDQLRVRLQVTGSSPTALRAKVWRAGTPEPGSWQVTATDSTAGLQTAGATGLVSYLGGSANPGTVSATFDDFSVASASTPPPPADNVAPKASFTATPSGLTVAFDGRGSSDSDGSVATWSWNFGDGTADAAGPTVSHDYAEGTFTATLTVTDDKGTTGVTTRQVTASSTPTPPSTTVVAQDAFGRSLATGFGTADTGGAWSLSGSSSNFSVGGGVGTIAAPAGSTRIAYLAGVTGTSLEVTATARTSRPSAGSVYAGVVGRRVGSLDYRAQANIASTGAVKVQVQRTGVTLQSITVPGLTYSTGDVLQIRMQTITTGGSTLVRARVWTAGSSEPTTWQVSATDSTAGLQVAGSVGVTSYTGSSTTPAPLGVSFDDFTVTRLP